MRARLLALLVLSVGCHSPDECSREGAQQCDGSGRGVVTCASTDRGLRWRTEACDPGTPACVERRDGTATCIGDSLGACEEADFVGSCVDENTLEECTASARHHVRCGEGESCGEVSEGSFGCYAPRPSADPPALVAFVRGDVHLGDRDPPAIPFRIPEGTQLRLGAGARVIVLVKERATILEGPREVDVYTLQPRALVASAWAAALEEILRRDAPRAVPPEEPLFRPAPSEDGLIRLVVGEGLPGASATLGLIAWRCEAGGCGETIEMRAQGADERVMWRGNGESLAMYEGPGLEAGRDYQLRLGERTYRVETMRPPNLLPLLASIRDWSLADQMAVIAAVHRWNGSRAAAAEALRRAHNVQPGNDAQLDEMLDAYGAR